MGKDAGTKCSHCGRNGHNARTCGAAGAKTIKIFGVKISQNKKEDPMMKSFSMGNLQAILSEHADGGGGGGGDDRGYLSDGPVRSRKEAHERKKGVPWTAEEHRVFLEGLKKLGKGDWRGISRNYVTTRTPTQVASHAQKYFLRQTAANKKKRRSSLFDMSIKDTVENSETKPLPSKESANFPKQTAPPDAQVPPALPIPTTQTVPQFNRTPYTMGNLGGQIGFVKSGGFTAVSVIPVANIHNVGYGLQSSKQHSNFSPHTPFASQSYLTPFSTSAAPQFVKMEPRGSPTVNTELKLSVATPDVGDRAKLPTHVSNMNGAIGVI